MKKLLAAVGVVVMACSLYVMAETPPAPAAGGDSKVVQFDVHNILNTRVVVTLTDGKIVDAKDNIDGAGGHATTAAAAFNKDNDPHALPNDGVFPANDQHPEVVLNYSDKDGTDNQALRMQGEGSFEFAVPENHYTKLFLFTTSGFGKASKLTVEMTYKDGTSDTKEVDAPDWWWDIKKEDADHTFFLAHDLSKFDKTGKMVGGEQRHHNIDGLELHPDASKIMTKVKVTKGKDALLVFYGATGVVK